MNEQEEFQKILKQTGIIMICPNCDGQDWSVVRSDLAIPNPGREPETVFLIRCDNCGHERFFSPANRGGPLAG